MQPGTVADDPGRYDHTHGLEDSFDRWEVKVSQLEMAEKHCEPVDSLEREFVAREQELELRDELAALLKGEETR